MSHAERALELLTAEQATRLEHWLPLDLEYANTGSGSFRASLRRFGITERMDICILALASHGGCAVCGESNPIGVLCIDHDHKTGLYRGLLCHRCNRALGSLDDDKMKVARMFSYLNRVSK